MKKLYKVVELSLLTDEEIQMSDGLTYAEAQWKVDCFNEEAMNNNKMFEYFVAESNKKR